MKQEYGKNVTTKIKKETYTKTKIVLSSKGKLNRIFFAIHVIEGEDVPKINVWGSAKNEEWDFNEANEYDLMRIFEGFALENPDEFKELYFNLKQNDPKVYPIIKEVLENIQQKFNFE